MAKWIVPAEQGFWLWLPPADAWPNGKTYPVIAWDLSADVPGIICAPKPPDGYEQEPHALRLPNGQVEDNEGVRFNSVEEWLSLTRRAKDLS